MSRRKANTGVYREGIGREGEQWTPMPFELLFSPAMAVLTARERDLYFAARRQETNARKHAERNKGVNPDLYPLDKWPDLKEMVGRRIPFYLNEALLVRHKDRIDAERDWLAQITKGKRIFTDGKNLKTARRKLVAFGLLDEIQVGAGFKRNVKGVYMLSDKWRSYTDEDIEQIKEQMRTGKEK